MARLCFSADHDAARPELFASCGFPISSCSVTLHNDDNEEVKPGEAGEICVRAPHAMEEYWKRPEQTAETFKGGWLHTGDIARADERGYLYVGTNRGIETRAMIRIIVEQARVPVVVDAGLGAPSHAAEAMELGAAAVLVNTAIAIAPDPAAMGRAFAMAVAADRLAYETGLATSAAKADATSPLTAFLG